MIKISNLYGSDGPTAGRDNIKTKLSACQYQVLAVHCICKTKLKASHRFIFG